MSKRDEFVNKALEYVGIKEKSKAHKEIVAAYNRACDKGREADINTLWCAEFVGAIAELTGNVLHDGIGVPVDYSCGTGPHSLVEKAKKAGIWVENDGYTPRKGDVVIYAWKDPKPTADNTTGHDHTGIVTSSAANSFVVTEGNKNNSVGNRRMQVNGKNIRGFIVPKFADEVAPSEPTPEPTPAPVGETYKVVKVKTNLRVRKGASLDAPVIARLENGDRVTVYGTENGFARLENCACYTDTTLTRKVIVPVGYASLDYLKKV